MLDSRLIFLRQGDRRARVYPERGFALYGFEEDVPGRGTATVIFGAEPGSEPADDRFGSPILFPTPSASNGPQGPDSWAREGRSLPIPFHGFARHAAWHVVDVGPAHVTGELTGTRTTDLFFPFAFRLRMTYRLSDAGLTLDAAVQNAGQDTFPYALGFHPYIGAPLGPKGTPADVFLSLPVSQRPRSTDRGQTFVKEPFAARRVRADEELVDSILLTEAGSYLELEDTANGLIARVSTEGSEGAFPYWVIWSATPESPFVCLEPWSDLPNALNRPATRRCLPGETHRYRMILSVRPS